MDLQNFLKFAFTFYCDSYNNTSNKKKCLRQSNPHPQRIYECCSLWMWNSILMGFVCTSNARHSNAFFFLVEYHIRTHFGEIEYVCVRYMCVYVAMGISCGDTFHHCGMRIDKITINVICFFKFNGFFVLPHASLFTSSEVNTRR